MRAALSYLLLLSATACVHAPSRFDGTWRIDLAEFEPPTKPEVYLLQDGTYRCSSREPPLEVTADGRDQKVAGEPYYDSVNVKVVDDSTIEETEKRGGRIVGTSRMTVSPDGSSATVEWTECSNANGDVVSGKDLLGRVTNGPPGSHAVSGSWQMLKRANLSENALVVTLELSGDVFSFADPTGQCYSARLDGTEAPFNGDLGNTVVSVRRIGEYSIEESDRRDGKVTEVIRYTVSADAKTMSVTMEDKPTGTVRQYLLRKL